MEYRRGSSSVSRCHSVQGRRSPSAPDLSSSDVTPWQALQLHDGGLSFNSRRLHSCSLDCPSGPFSDTGRHNPALQRGLLFLWLPSFCSSWCNPATPEDRQSHPKRSQCAPDTEGSSTPPPVPSSRCACVGSSPTRLHPLGAGPATGSGKGDRSNKLDFDLLLAHFNGPVPFVAPPSILFFPRPSRNRLRCVPISFLCKINKPAWQLSAPIPARNPTQAEPTSVRSEYILTTNVLENRRSKCEPKS